MSGIAGKFTRRTSRVVALLAALGGGLMATGAPAAGLLTPTDGSPTLVLDEHHVEVTIENGYAVTRVEQVFANPHVADRDARYSFPVPESAAVGEFTYWIDGKPVQAEVMKKADARELHEEQKRQGNETALVEKDAYRTFMLTLTPGIDLAPIGEGSDWVFVLDTSGSMAGKFTALVEGVRRLLGSLSPADRYRVILFSDRAKELTNSYLSADAASVAHTLQQLDRLRAGGGTNLFDGLTQAVRSLDADRTTAVVLVTDGVANVGTTEMSRFLKLVEPLDIRLFTAVMGNSANRPLLDGLTEHSQGFAVSVSNDDDIVGLMMQVSSKVTHEALHDVRIDIDGVRTTALTPARHNRVYRGEQLVMLGRYTGSGNGKVTLEASVSGQQKRYVSPALFPLESTTNPELERLWAFATIEDLEASQRLLGSSEDRQDAITDVALAHGLVTDHTSMIVVRDEVFVAEGIDRRNATRVEREQVARAARASQPVANTRQDTQVPAFPSNRQTTSNGGGSLGAWLLLTLALLAAVRIVLGLCDRRRERRSTRDDGVR